MNPGPERLALQELHRQEDELAVHPRLEHADQVGVLDGHREADSADEPVDELGARRELGEDELQRPDVARDAVARLVDRAHAAPAERGEDS